MHFILLFEKKIFFIVFSLNSLLDSNLFSGNVETWKTWILKISPRCPPQVTAVSKLPEHYHFRIWISWAWNVWRKAHYENHEKKCTKDQNQGFTLNKSPIELHDVTSICKIGEYFSEWQMRWVNAFLISFSENTHRAYYLHQLKMTFTNTLHCCLCQKCKSLIR